MLRLGINGFGRIGRNLLRAAIHQPDMAVVAVNDLTDTKTLAHLLKYDSLLGTFAASVRHDDANLFVNDSPIAVSASRDPGAIAWGKHGVDIVIESTGHFTDRAQAELHMTRGGAKRVIISAPAKNEDVTIVMGVNHSAYAPAKHRIVSNGSCTTNALAPVAKVLNDTFGIAYGQMVTTHAFTNTQALHDQPAKNLRSGRAATQSIIPYSTGAAKAIGKVLPELDGKLSGFSLRVPVPVVSIVDLTVQVETDTDVDRVNAAFEAAAQGAMRGILGCSREPLVSADYRGDDRSSIVDALSTLVSGKRMVKALAWYDNEWAFSKRLLDLAALMQSAGI